MPCMVVLLKFKTRKRGGCGIFSAWVVKHEMHQHAAALGWQQAKKPGGGRVPSARSSEHSTKSAQHTPIDGVRRVWGVH